MNPNRPIPLPLRRLPAAQARRQRGVVLFIALIVLVAMSIAGIAMFRQVGIGVTIAGNLAFKQNATDVADLGTEDAIAWLTGAAPYGIAPPSLNTDQAPGYKACAMDAPPPFAGICPWTNFDPTTFNWTTDAVQSTPDDGTGNKVQYVIHRLCAFVNGGTGDPANTPCVTFGSVGAGGSKGGGAYGVLPLANTAQPYFRITSRAEGPRQTVSYVQVIMY